MSDQVETRHQSRDTLRAGRQVRQTNALARTVQSVVVLPSILPGPQAQYAMGFSICWAMRSASLTLTDWCSGDDQRRRRSTLVWTDRAIGAAHRLFGAGRLASRYPRLTNALFTTCPPN